MNKKDKYVFFGLIYFGLIVLVVLFMFSNHIAVLTPKGIIAEKQLEVILKSTFYMLIIVIPVLILAFIIPWHYRGSNKRANYDPEWDHSYTAEAIWWGVPLIIIFILSILTWNSSHSLDPFKPIDADTKPLKIQVVALQWKWLFVYPEQQVATVNYMPIPEKTPIQLDITADAPMNSFWLPELAGQIYAMPGMKTTLYLKADEEGSFRGSSANISGTGFASMFFTAKSSSQDDFFKWVDEAKQSQKKLNEEEYNKIAAPSQDFPNLQYTLEKQDLFDSIINKYMVPAQETKTQ
ncbi:MAG: ubiquinol oxidase subunit II [Chlamydia sp. 32-24]|nr:MAG: ubiquinol oxidase subunit II [Chlamydia sp. 32-24]